MLSHEQAIEPPATFRKVLAIRRLILVLFKFPWVGKLGFRVKLSLNFDKSNCTTLSNLLIYDPDFYSRGLCAESQDKGWLTKDLCLHFGGHLLCVYRDPLATVKSAPIVFVIYGGMRGGGW